MSEVVVRTKSELETAKNNKAEVIIVEGELASKLKKSKKIAYASTATIALISAAAVTVPATGGFSLVGLVPLATLSGIEIAGIIAIIFLGVGFLVALFKDYEEIDFDAKSLRLKLKRKSKL